jgi:hypothetical protein
VTLPGDRRPDGAAVRYSGRALAPDLAWPKLLTRWATTPAPTLLPRNEEGRVPPAVRHENLRAAGDIADRAATAIRGSSEDVDGISHATGELLTVLARNRDGRDPGPLTDLARCYDRAARTPYRVLPASAGPIARELRRAARQIAAAGALSGRGNEKFAVAALLLALSGLVAEIAAWQQQRGRGHQAAAAHTTAAALRPQPAFRLDPRPVTRPTLAALPTARPAQRGWTSNHGPQQPGRPRR